MLRQVHIDCVQYCAKKLSAIGLDAGVELSITDDELKELVMKIYDMKYNVSLCHSGDTVYLGVNISHIDQAWGKP